VGGIVILVHAGHVIMQQRKSKQMASASDSFISLEVYLQVLVGVLMALVGGVEQAGLLKPIRTRDQPKTPWDSLHERINFRVYSHRSRYLQPRGTGAPSLI